MKGLINSWDPLVSIVIITYNSGNYVLETLDSAKKQTYQNIELIISDDCSQDETVKICKKWLEENGWRFVRTELVTTLKNTGTAGNLNRGIKVATGEWIKIIAGDDALYPDLINQYVNYIKENPAVQFLHSKVVHYKGIFDEKFKLPIEDAKKYKINAKGLTPKEQFEILLRTSLVGTPTVMIKTTVFQQVGLFDERFPLWEDRPMFLKITGSGIRLQFINITGAKYRITINSVSKVKKHEKLISDFGIYKNRAYKKLCLPYISGYEKILKVWTIQLQEIFYKMNSKGWLVKRLYSILVLPFVYLVNQIDQNYK